MGGKGSSEKRSRTIYRERSNYWPGSTGIARAKVEGGSAISREERRNKKKRRGKERIAAP